MPFSPFVTAHLRELLDQNFYSMRLADSERDASMYFASSSGAAYCIHVLGGMAGQW